MAPHGVYPEACVDDGRWQPLFGDIDTLAPVEQSHASAESSPGGPKNAGWPGFGLCRIRSAEEAEALSS
jgi:hypothetical protein